MKGIIFEDCCEEEEEGDVAKEMMMTKKNRLRRIRDDVGEGDDGECHVKKVRITTSTKMIRWRSRLRGRS